MRKGSALVIATALFVAACGGGDDPSTGEVDQTDPTPVTEVQGQVVEAPTPTAVVVVVEPAPLSYAVQQGDTLGVIAQQFGVSVEAIMEANDLENADFISIGQELVIPEPSVDE